MIYGNPNNDLKVQGLGQWIKALLGLLFILGVFYLGAWAERDGRVPHPERAPFNPSEWNER